MAARSGMVDLLLELRGMTNAGSADYSVAGASYWTDDQLQAILDKRRTEVVNESLTHLEEYSGGSAVITRYYSQYGNFEKSTGGSAVFVVRDGVHNLVGTANYTPDYARGEVIYSTNTLGSALYVTGRSYNLNAAAADVWDRKAAQVVSSSYSWSSDNMRVDKSSARKEAVDMARYYRGLGGPVVVDVERSDTNKSWNRWPDDVD